MRAVCSAHLTRVVIVVDAVLAAAAAAVAVLLLVAVKKARQARCPVVPVVNNGVIIAFDDDGNGRTAGWMFDNTADEKDDDETVVLLLFTMWCARMLSADVERPPRDHAVAIILIYFQRGRVEKKQQIGDVFKRRTKSMRRKPLPTRQTKTTNPPSRACPLRCEMNRASIRGGKRAGGDGRGPRRLVVHPVKDDTLL